MNSSGSLSPSASWETGHPVKQLNTGRFPPNVTYKITNLGPFLSWELAQKTNPQQNISNFCLYQIFEIKFLNFEKFCHQFLCNIHHSYERILKPMKQICKRSILYFSKAQQGPVVLAPLGPLIFDCYIEGLLYNIIKVSVIYHYKTLFGT